MDSKAVVLQGTRYPICLVLAKQPAPSGFIAVATCEWQQANQAENQSNAGAG